MTTSPIPVEQFGSWLGELLSALESAGQTLNPAPSPSSLQPGPAGLVHSIAQIVPHSNQAFAHSLSDDEPHSLRAAARLRDHIIRNLGSS
jgi:hypothetical protein